MVRLTFGDLHQPMHVSREEDKGGNTIQVNYSGVGTNLHALWDSKLLDHLGGAPAQPLAYPGIEDPARRDVASRGAGGAAGCTTEASAPVTASSARRLGA